MVEAVLLKIQACTPTGVFARDVRECLMLQLRERDRLDPLMQRLIDNLDLLAAHDMLALTRAVGADREDLLDMLAELKRLDPKPGRGFEAAQVEAVIPDVFVREGRGGAWAVELNTRRAAAGAGQPRLLRDGHQAGPRLDREGLPHRLPRDRQLADQEPRPARPDHPQGRDRDRAASRTASSPTASPTSGR